MTKATTELIHELCEIIDENKYLLLSGGSAVGKTYLATEVANNCRLPEYNAQGKLSVQNAEYEVEAEIIPIHSAYTYEDFVCGISFASENGNINFEYRDKVFLLMLKEANQSWDIKSNKKYFLILDDIGRGSFSGILGNVLPLIEPHGNHKFCITMQDGTSLQIPPNFYIIATCSSLIEAIDHSNISTLRHFYHKEIIADYSYMSEGATNTYGEYDTSPNAMFNRVKRIIVENLRYRNQLSIIDRERYVIGHGVFQPRSVSLAVRHQVVPLLKQYLKENILDWSAKMGIDILEKMVTGEYTKDKSLSECSITKYRSDVTSAIFYSEDTTHKPIVNLVFRIKTQGLMSDDDISNLILFNPGVLIRKSGTLNGVVRDFPSPAYLFVRRSERDIYSYGTTITKDGSAKRPRYFYSSNISDTISIKGVEYASAAEMQPKEYTRWSEDLNSDFYVNERGSSSPNSIMFRILRSYYNCLITHYSNYLSIFPNDKNIFHLKTFAEAEFEELIRKIKLIGSGSDEANVNLERNRQFREAIGQLTLLWADVGDTINWNGQPIKVEGVYKVDTLNSYKDYSKAMETLGIHQMILQGPPGTSKTYSAREFLKFIGKGIENDDFLTDDELDSLQIKNYGDEVAFSTWKENNPGESPSIAWDIVQFHPSYGYEDFVRGIEVSTVRSADGSTSNISYDTVNKVLGKIADLATKEDNKNTKFILVIDEINRANLATVFGELIYGLEYRGQSVATPYMVNTSSKIKLPENLYIIGTMNTADKSIGGIDYAIRRRFLFFSLLPNKEIILSYNINSGDSEETRTAQLLCNQKAACLFEAVGRLFDQGNLNAEYYKDDVQIGHTYFLVNSEEQLYLRFKYQILPILKEYHKDGMFQFENQGTNDGFGDLINCISGVINIHSDDEKIHEVFDKLISEN